ncbi:MAG TPA: peptidogalycan biosysnthesis protein [Myxococcales bacterium]|jgi:predicted N-acyltransferase|nr:peptidogalycan biosysnthesis protein [Myxococcales bacterium]
MSNGYDTKVVDSLRDISDAELDQVTAGSNLFLDRRWLRIFEAVDFSTLVRGEAPLRHVTVRSGDTLVAVCPFLTSRSPTIITQYSLEKFFFTSWKANLARMNPESASWSRWLARAAEGYRRMARLLRTGVEGWVLAGGPLSFRGGIACRATDPAETRRIHQAVLKALQDVSRAERLPLCFYCVEAHDPLRDALREGGFEELFFTFDNRIDTELRDLDEYFDRFPGKPRRHFKYEIRRVESQGYRFQLVSDYASIAPQIEKFYTATYSKYGEGHPFLPADFWRQLQQSLGPRSEAVVAFRGEEPTGFSMLLHKAEEMFVYRIGRPPREDGQEPPVYFSLLFYEPIKRAVELKVKRLWLSGGAWEGKRRRGARGYPLYNCFWFPNARSRVVLGSFLSLYSRMSFKQVSRVVARPEQESAS